jgi:hypothetical protein
VIDNEVDLTQRRRDRSVRMSIRGFRIGRELNIRGGVRSFAGELRSAFSPGSRRCDLQDEHGERIDENQKSDRHHPDSQVLPLRKSC